MLLLDAERLSLTGYLRVDAARHHAVGQVGLREGTPFLALFENPEGLTMGAEAFSAFLESSLADDARITLHTDVDLDLIERLHPLARLYRTDADADDATEAAASGDEVWWLSVRRQSRRWKRLDTWVPELAEEVEPDAPKPAPLPVNIGHELMPGMVGLTDSAEPIPCLRIASHLAAIGHPVLCITRMHPTQVKAAVDLADANLRWLTERASDESVALSASLEEVRRAIDQFLFAQERAFIVLDGLEYLSGLHGQDRMLAMLRNLVDGITSADHFLLIPADLAAWDTRERAVLLREVDPISTTLIESWSARPAIVEGHPFCAEGWSMPEIPAPKAIEVATPEAPANDVNRWSMTEVVEAWKEETTAKVEAIAAAPSESSELPAWATAPSPNMIQPTGMPEANETVPEVAEVEEAPVSKPPNLRPKARVKAASRGPRPATVNHSGNAPRRARATSKKAAMLPQAELKGAAMKAVDVEAGLPTDGPDLRLAGMQESAARAIEVEAAVVEPPTFDAAVESLTASTAHVRDVGRFESKPELEMHTRSLTAAMKSASGDFDTAEAPPLTENASAREKASQAQRSQRFGAWLAQSEREAIGAAATLEDAKEEDA